MTARAVGEGAAMERAITTETIAPAAEKTDGIRRTPTRKRIMATKTTVIKQVKTEPIHGMEKKATRIIKNRQNKSGGEVQCTIIL